MRAPIGLLKPTAIANAFQALVRKSGLEIPFQLLKNGTPLKTIGDILGHRSTESTSVYPRLATGDLREVPLPMPGQRVVRRPRSAAMKPLFPRRSPLCHGAFSLTISRNQTAGCT